jgi:uncharacterized membrane protein
MKKIIKYTGIVIAVLAVTVIGLNIASSDEKEIAIVIEQEVNAPAKDVYDKVRHLKNYPSWSPFLLKDPQQKYSLSNVDGEVGAKFHWVGVKEESEGYQEIVGLEDNKAVNIKCTITVPFEAKPAFDYYFAERGNKTIVTQKFKVQMPFPANIIAHFTNLRKEMKQTNETGLALLKKVCEGNLAQK